MKQTRRLVLAILILNLPWAAQACAPEATTPNGKIRQRLTLSGDTTPQIDILLGAPSWIENTRLTFAQARWDFFPNGTFRFTSGAAADVQDDLYSLSGIYRAVGDHLEFHATRRSDLGASVSLAGYLWGFPSKPRIVAVEGSVWTGYPKIGRIVQTLQAPLEKRSDDNWPPVPARYSITVRGQVEEEPFGPLAGLLTLSPPQEGDPNPLSLSLHTSEQDQHGSLAWSSFLTASEPRVQLNSVTLHPADKEIVAQMLPGAKDLLSLFWVRFAQPPKGMPDLGTMPDWVQAEEGAVRLRLNGSRLSGDVKAHGRGQQPGKIRYEARIEGELQGDEDGIQSPPPANPYTGEVLFGGIWHSRQHGEFQLRQTAKTVEGAFAAGGGTKLAGQADGNVLSFHWSNQKGGEGTGIFVALSDRSALAGILLEEPSGTWRIEMAERREMKPGAGSQLPSPASREDLKDRGDALVMEGRCIEAIEPLEQAWALYRQDRDRTEIPDLTRDRFLIDEINILNRLSFCHTRLGRFEDLLANLREAIRVYQLLASKPYLNSSVGSGPAILSDLLEAHRRQLADLEKIQAQDASRTFFEELAGLLLELKQPAEALVTSEKARARAFADLLAADEARRSLPGGQVLRAGTTLPVTAASLKAAVQRSRSTVVEYMLTEQRLIIWVVSPEGEVQVETVPVTRQALEGLVRELLPLLESSYRGDRAGKSRSAILLEGHGAPEEGPRRNLRRLYDYLIAPISTHLPPQEGARVTFVPQGLLFLVPFPALLDAQDQPLLTRFTPMTSPAIGVLASLHAPSTARWAAPEVLVVGNPSGDLKDAEREARTVASLFGASPILGATATRERVVAAMPGARLIHFASHGLLEHGEEKDVPGALVLAPSGRGSGLLTAREIAGLRLRADLVVLSACDSGSGRLTGDGVVGLARSFLAAGANGVVVSLWRVDDEATALLMKEFYRQLKPEGDRAQALRRAMIETRKTFSDPQQWAAFTFIGIEPEAQ